MIIFTAKLIIMKRELIILMSATMIGCSAPKESASTVKENSITESHTYALPPVVVYKTTKDYYDKVPVGLSSDKKSIVSFPGKGDVRMGDGYATPVRLHDGYLLDRRGVGRNSAFTDITYEEYAKIENVTRKMLMEHILDSEPFEEMWVGEGRRVSSDSINAIIDSKKLGDVMKRVL